MAGPARDDLVDHLGIFGVVEDEQPVLVRHASLQRVQDGLRRVLDAGDAGCGQREVGARAASEERTSSGWSAGIHHTRSYSSR